MISPSPQTGAPTGSYRSLSAGVSIPRWPMPPPSVSGCGLVLLDRFDVLDVRSRSQFIRLALAMDAQTIAAGTLKETPGAMPGKLQAVWLGG